MRRLVPVAALMTLALMTACGDDSEGSGGSTSTGTTTTTGEGGQGGAGQGGAGQGGAGGADCSDGGPNYGQPCASNADCGCGVCFGFMMGNNLLCTIPCPTGGECPPPATQCNNQNACGGF